MAGESREVAWSGPVLWRCHQPKPLMNQNIPPEANRHTRQGVRFTYNHLPGKFFPRRNGFCSFSSNRVQGDGAISWF